MKAKYCAVTVRVFIDDLISKEDYSDFDAEARLGNLVEDFVRRDVISSPYEGTIISTDEVEPYNGEFVDFEVLIDNESAEEVSELEKRVLVDENASSTTTVIYESSKMRVDVSLEFLALQFVVSLPFGK